MTKIKFCGTMDPQTVPVINGIMPDYLGFIMTKRFWRYISPETALRIREGLDSRITAVGVFVDEPIEYAERILLSGIADIAQLHGSEDDGYIKRLRDRTKKPVIKAFKVASQEDAERAFRSSADFVLLDSGTGTGRAFDWSLIKGFQREYFLAGGLDPENVGEAVRTLKPYCVDVSSGIETDRKKDPEKMIKFAAQVRGIL